MLLYRWQGAVRNFGDELNTLLWPRLLPDWFDQDAREIFLGIGSVLDDRHPQQARKLVAGAGFGGYQRLPERDRSWIIHWTRGPRTAQALGLPSALGLGDPASMLPQVVPMPERCGEAIGLMPHFESLGWGAWETAARLAGFRLIDPTTEPQQVIQAIAGCRLLLSEALHGIIVADAMRVPWIALRPRLPVHRAKWQDWADTLGLCLLFQPLPSSSLLEWLHACPAAERHPIRQTLAAGGSTLRRVAAGRWAQHAAHGLQAAAHHGPQLSADAALERCQDRMLSRIDALRRNPRQGCLM